MEEYSLLVEQVSRQRGVGIIEYVRSSRYYPENQYSIRESVRANCKSLFSSSGASMSRKIFFPPEDVTAFRRRVSLLSLFDAIVAFVTMADDG